VVCLTLVFSLFGSDIQQCVLTLVESELLAKVKPDIQFAFYHVGKSGQNYECCSKRLDSIEDLKPIETSHSVTSANTSHEYTFIGICLPELGFRPWIAKTWLASSTADQSRVNFQNWTMLPVSSAPSDF
jgi:hypothetical protein